MLFDKIIILLLIVQDIVYYINFKRNKCINNIYFKY